jgi:hypothetical protein
MESRAVSRCVAIAAHGKRCQQSPFRGSPYCWHHTQSRKIWAPSRPLGSGPQGRTVEAPLSDQDPDRRGAEDRRVRGDRRAGWAAEDAVARRLCDLLGPERVEELLEFLQSPADGAYLLVRDEGGLLSERSISERPVRRRSA